MRCRISRVTFSALVTPQSGITLAIQGRKMSETSVLKTGEPPALQMRLLGRTGLKISEIGFGAWGIGGGFNIAGRGIGYGNTDDAISLAALQRAFELGVNFVDTSDAYGSGHSEELVGKAIKLSPRRVHVATKVGHVRRDPQPSEKNFSREYVKNACDRSLERLGVTMIDLYQLHNPPLTVIESQEVWETLRELKDKSKIAHYGIAVGSPQEGIYAIEKGEAETVQITYNLLDREAAKDLFAVAERKSVGIIARSPLASGLLAGKFASSHRFPDNDHRKDAYPPDKLDPILQRVENFRFLERKGRSLSQAALRFCLAHPAVSVAIAGIKSPAQAEENVHAAFVQNLSDDELKRIAEL
jgi:aryl-alcohol dehydrogenase-like predicted oxidoreductase